MKKAILKIIIAASISFMVLSLFSKIYYNLPIKNVNTIGTTDYVFEPNKFHSRGTEGYSFGKTNNEGFNNLDDYTDQNIDILVMGSSHMEAFNVLPTQSTVAKLNEILGKDMFTYNIGVSAHNIYTVISNLDAALERYNPKKYVILETMTLIDDKKSLNNVLNDEVLPVGKHSSGIVRTLESFDYLKLLSSQLKSYTDNIKKNNKKSNEKPKDIKKYDYIEELDNVLRYVNEISIKKDIVPIILFHQNLFLGKDGTIISKEDENKVEILKYLCDKNDIVLLDMTDRFIQEYGEERVLPHGFSNTRAGVGHLNKYGHAMIAEELSDIILEMEGLK